MKYLGKSQHEYGSYPKPKSLDFQILKRGEALMNYQEKSILIQLMHIGERRKIILLKDENYESKITLYKYFSFVKVRTC